MICSSFSKEQTKLNSKWNSQGSRQNDLIIKWITGILEVYYVLETTFIKHVQCYNLMLCLVHNLERDHDCCNCGHLETFRSPKKYSNPKRCDDHRTPPFPPEIKIDCF